MSLRVVVFLFLSCYEDGIEYKAHSYVPQLQVHYSILKDASEDYQYFNIDSKLGVISTQASFDREKRGSYLIEVHSQDSSESARPGLYGQPNTGKPQWVSERT